MARARYLSSLSTSVLGIEPASTLLEAGSNSGIGKETGTAQISYGKQMQKLLWEQDRGIAFVSYYLAHDI